MKQLLYFNYSYWLAHYWECNFIIVIIKYLKFIGESEFKILLGLFDVLLSVGLIKMCCEFDKVKTRLFFKIA